MACFTAVFSWHGRACSFVSQNFLLFNQVKWLSICFKQRKLNRFFFLFQEYWLAQLCQAVSLDGNNTFVFQQYLWHSWLVFKFTFFLFPSLKSKLLPVPGMWRCNTTVPLEKQFLKSIYLIWKSWFMFHSCLSLLISLLEAY